MRPALLPDSLRVRVAALSRSLLRPLPLLVVLSLLLLAGALAVVAYLPEGHTAGVRVDLATSPAVARLDALASPSPAGAPPDVSTPGDDGQARTRQ